jgi:hypothetical protein
MSGLRASFLAAAVLAAGLPGGGAMAQSAGGAAGDFRLQPGASPSPRAAGPVDPETPRPVPAAQPSAQPGAGPSGVPAAPVTVSPVPTTPPVITPPPRALATPSAAPARPRTEPAAAATPEIAPAPALAPAAPTASVEPPVAAPSPLPAPVVASEAPAALAPGADGGISPWWLAALALLAALGAGLWWRRAHAATTVDDEPADDRVALAPVAPSPRPMAAPAAPVAPEVVAPAADEGPLALALEPLRLSVSLMNATLHYRLAVTNRSAAPIGPLAVAADMIGAHASLSEEAQLGRDGAGLELRHELPALAPGQSAELAGELRLPLSAITPIRAGDATLLVPLVRLRAEIPGWSTTRALVVGEAPEAPGGRLKPFRLDSGPRIFARIDQREVASAA